MSDQFRLTEEQIERFRPHFPKVRGKLRVDDRKVLSGIIHVACPLLSGPLTMFGLDLEGADHGQEAARA